nr:SDR family oxidoreductase [uncultured Cohaesibacter sp.]
MKHCIITGANRGVGLALVDQYLRQGDWHVHACCRQPEKADSLRQRVTEHLGRITLHALEVTDQTSVDKLAAALKEQPIDLLINNAGIKGSKHQSRSDMDYDGWMQTFAVNAMAPLRVSEALLPNLKAVKGAKIATVSSQMGAICHKGTGQYAYRSSKAAVNKVMSILAQELEADGLVCLLLHPGWVKTDMGGSHAEITPEESAKGIMQTIEAATVSDNGSFFKWNGEPHGW